MKRIIATILAIPFALLLAACSSPPARANDYFNASGAPSTGSALSSSTMRAEFSNIGAGFDKLPALSGNSGKSVVINPGATGLTVTTGTLALGGNFTVSGASALTLTTTGVTVVTIPLTGTLSTLAGSEELTNKTITSPVMNGTWTASGTVTLPAITLGGTVSGGGNQLNNVVIGATSPGAGTFTTVTTTGRVLGTQGADVASAGNMSLGNDGNYFLINGTTTILRIDSTGWTNGSVVRVRFNTSLIVNNAKSVFAPYYGIALAGNADFSATSNDVLTLVLDTTLGFWVEVSRSVN